MLLPILIMSHLSSFFKGKSKGNCIINIFFFQKNSLLDAAMLNNHDALLLGYYYARPLCARTKGKQTVIQDKNLVLSNELIKVELPP